MTFDEFDTSTWRTFAGCSASFREQLITTALGVAGEGGEFVDAVKKCMFHGDALDRITLLTELGDILYYISVAATVLGSSLEHVAVNNNSKLQQRYPDGFPRERRTQRELFNEQDE